MRYNMMLLLFPIKYSANQEVTISSRRKGNHYIITVPKVLSGEVKPIVIYVPWFQESHTSSIVLTYLHSSLHLSKTANTDNYLLVISIIIVFELVIIVSLNKACEVQCFVFKRKGERRKVRNKGRNVLITARINSAFRLLHRKDKHKKLLLRTHSLWKLYKL